MRIYLLILIGLFATPALAQGWYRYANDRFGYVIEVPPDFGLQNGSDNGDGASFALPGKRRLLVVWGGHLTRNFETEVARQMAGVDAEGWNLTYQATTPGWASFAAIKGLRILSQRLVLLCDGQSYAAFQTEYSATEAAEMNPMIERLAGSLRGNC